MKTIGFFNNKGGVGKTTLVYHVAWMMAQLGQRVVAVDLDPQANLTSMFLDESRLETIWDQSGRRATLYGAVSPQFRGVGDVDTPQLATIDSRLALIVGDLELSRVESDLSVAWPSLQLGDERAFRVTSAFGRAIQGAADAFDADVALVDVGPNLGALNRSALLACDFVVVPLGADLFSLQGLRNMGPTIRDWREVWAKAKLKSPDPTLALPSGRMLPIGYVVMRHSVLAGRPARAFSKWIARMPQYYSEYVLDEPGTPGQSADTDPNRLARLKDYRSLLPMAQEARKPIFLLRPGDGAFGGHQAAVADCYADFKDLALKILSRTDAHSGVFA